jgi:cobalt-precorrin-5B (C1)-methyltransferase
VRALYGLDEVALLEMGDFVGGMLKYLRTHPVARVTVAGGVAKLAKLAQGRLDLHSGRGAVDMAALAALAAGTESLTTRLIAANTAAEAFAIAAAAGVALGDLVAEAAWMVAAEVLAGSGSVLDVVLFDATGALVGRSAIRAVHGRKRLR